MKKNIMVVAPHPDDEILGCGGSIHKHSVRGCNVFVLIMTNANKYDPVRFTEDKRANIVKEAIKAHSLVGVKETYFEDFPAPALDQVPLNVIAESISNFVQKLNIDVLYIPHRGDIHNDHKVIFDAAMVAGRPNGSYSIKTILSYETLSETEWAHPFPNDAFIPNYFEIINTDSFEKKISAMNCYHSQLRNFPSSRSIEALTALGKYRGSTVNRYYAEAFMIMRSITD